MRIIELQVLLHTYCTSDPYPHDTTAVRTALESLMSQGMIGIAAPSPSLFYSASSYEITPRGQFFVEHLKTLPLPRKIETYTMEVE